jgi:hypothetical protein
MITLRTLAPLLGLALLPGCIVPIPVPNGTPGSFVVDQGSACGARGLQDYLGEDVALVERTDFQGAPGPMRIIRPGDVVTEEYLAERLNFRIDAAGKVSAVDCG